MTDNTGDSIRGDRLFDEIGADRSADRRPNLFPRNAEGRREVAPASWNAPSDDVVRVAPLFETTRKYAITRNAR
jgi:hypothetical protein